MANFHSTKPFDYKAEEIRKDEYPMMIGKTYLDHGGTTIYAKSLIDSFSQRMVSNLYGNPHSDSSPAMLSGSAVDDIRRQALGFFGADPAHFDLVFVANATAAVKLVMECFRDLAAADDDAAAAAAPSSTPFWYGYHKDAHTSVVGVREATRSRHCFRGDAEVERWLSGESASMGPADGQLGLFAYPGQSNMTGRRLPRCWASRLRGSRRPGHNNIYSLFDAAALATTSPLNSLFADPDDTPDFTALSFYKIFGFPDLGALIVRKQSGHILEWRKYFGGGTVDMVTVLHQEWHKSKASSLHDSLEDGTLPFHSIIALGCAIDVHQRLYGSMEAISKHTNALSKRMYDGMRTLTHGNGRAALVMYNDAGHDHSDPTTQGPTIAFNVLLDDSPPSYVPYTHVERLADAARIYVRSGGLCNAGGIASHLELAPWQMKRSWSAGHRCGHGGQEIISGKPTGVVRASLGAMSTATDVDGFLDFLRGAFVRCDERPALSVGSLPSGSPFRGYRPGLLEGAAQIGGSVARFSELETDVERAASPAATLETYSIADDGSGPLSVTSRQHPQMERGGWSVDTITSPGYDAPRDKVGSMQSADGEKQASNVETNEKDDNRKVRPPRKRFWKMKTRA